MSRPTESVPNQWPVSRLGGVEACSQSVKSASQGSSIGPTTTASTTSNMMTPLTIAARFFSRRCHASTHNERPRTSSSAIAAANTSSTERAVAVVFGASLIGPRRSGFSG